MARRNISTNSTGANTMAKLPRNPNVCQSCRASKRGCDGRRPTCERCVRRGVPCVYIYDTVLTASKDAVGSDTYGPRRSNVPGSVNELDHEHTRLRIHHRDAAGLAGGDDNMDVDVDTKNSEDTVEVLDPNTWAPKDCTIQKPQSIRSQTTRIITESEEPEQDWNHSYAPPSQNPFLAAEATTSLRHAEAMLALRANDPTPEPQAVHFNDIDLSALSPEASSEWTAIKRKVYASINLPSTGIEWDTDGTKRSELRDLILEVHALQQKRSKVPELVLALGRLAKMLMLFHDFFEQLGACMTSLTGLEISLDGHAPLAKEAGG